MTAIEGYSLAVPSMQEVRSETDLAALVETYSTLLFRVAHSILRNRGEAEDVVKDAFVRVIENRRKLPEVRDLRVWLVRIAWNLALDRTRRIRPDQLDAGFAESLAACTVAADQALDEARHIQAVLREMDRLPKPERAVLLLSAMNEISTAQIADVLGKTESAVRALLFRARARLRQRLEKGSRA